jgi:uncharacterized protein (DUF433 family)
MNTPYIEQKEGIYRVVGTRVSLDSVVAAFSQGLSPESIAAECFPSLALEQVYGAIAYYLGHRAEIDAYLQQAEIDFAVLRQTTHQMDQSFYEKLMQARRLQMTQV